jgi:hypothetical protein
LNSILFVILLAIGWHASLFWLERSRQPCPKKPSLAKLLRLVELDVLGTIRGELVRALQIRPDLKPGYDRKLQNVNEQLSLLGGQDVS